MAKDKETISKKAGATKAVTKKAVIEKAAPKTTVTRRAVAKKAVMKKAPAAKTVAAPNKVVTKKAPAAPPRPMAKPAPAPSGSLPQEKPTPQRLAQEPKGIKSGKPKPAFVGPEERIAMIEEAAYYKAEKRNFAPGFDAEDWAEAEREIDEKIKKQRA